MTYNIGTSFRRLSSFSAEFALQFHCPAGFFRRAIHRCIGIHQRDQLAGRFNLSIFVGDINNGSVQAIVRRLGDLGPADADSSTRQVTGAITYPEYTAYSCHFGGQFLSPLWFRTSGRYSPARLAAYVNRRREDHRVEENLLAFETVSPNRCIEYPFCQLM